MKKKIICILALIFVASSYFAITKVSLNKSCISIAEQINAKRLLVENSSFVSSKSLLTLFFDSQFHDYTDEYGFSLFKDGVCKLSNPQGIVFAVIRRSDKKSSEFHDGRYELLDVEVWSKDEVVTVWSLIDT